MVGLRIGVAGIIQTQILPDSIISIMVQLPLVALIIWLQLQNQKWIEHMLEVQRVSLKGVYEGQNKFLDNRLGQIEGRQKEIVNSVDKLKDEISIMRATLGEAVNVKDVVDQLMDRMPRSTD